MDKKEENFVQEIMTLERHIDHITRQLEDLNKHYHQCANERDQLLDELQTFKSIHNNQESSKTEL
jgi:regulator of replication initiation timing